MGKRSRDKGGEGERNVGRLFLRKGYLAWRTSQNRQSKLDDESDDVSASMTPEHMRCDEDGTENRYGDYLDLYYVNQEKYPEQGEHTRSIEEFEPIPNLTIEVKNGYDTKTYNKMFADWLEKLHKQTPEENFPVLFWRRNYASPFEYRACYEKNGITTLTIDEAETMKAIDEIADMAADLRE